ncbi:hypothetical protein CC86DRAFT_191100 [Ophiobolus disseminans]|uniref:Rhodopsin domain-containing protein n=1 Tax=Ophiobolus disseminans TaxID=1469910 RepID=A0A6A7A8B9_9PLEO|nr:hypothetical protein CC86DRAFT_191100 [Ophiobolus disseminans]
MGDSGMNQFLPAILDMLKHPPDPNANKPLTNLQEVVYGVTLPCLILSWLAVGFRLHVRFRVVREPGLDDVFVILSAVLNLVAHIAFYGGLRAGLGQHLIHILGILATTMKWSYVANGAYLTTTACVKLSLLLQYLRLFRGGYQRTVTVVLLVMVVVWGGITSFMIWFPCFPVSSYWDRAKPGRCYGFGFGSLQGVKDTLFAYAGSNMALDIAIFLLPLTMFLKRGLKRKQVLAMTGLFALGSIVVVMAILRLWSGVKYNNTNDMYDFTWWLPGVLFFSCLEVDFALMCASMPIFWPMVVAAWSDIFVTSEVIVSHRRRSQHLGNNASFFELDGATSLKSHASTDGMKHSISQEVTPWETGFDPILGTGPGTGITQVEVQTRAQKARIL